MSAHQRAEARQRAERKGRQGYLDGKLKANTPYEHSLWGNGPSGDMGRDEEWNNPTVRSNGSGSRRGLDENSKCASETHKDQLHDMEAPMGSRKRKLCEGDEAILLSLKNSAAPVTADALYDAVQAFFADRRDFGRAVASMTKGRLIFVKNVDDVRRYSLDPANGDDYEDRRRSKEAAATGIPQPGAVPQLYEIYTRDALAMIASIRSKPVKPSATNSMDSERA